MAPAKKAMTKAQIVSHLAEKFELPKKTASALIEEIAELAVSQTKKVGEFTVPGIGKLVKTKRQARTGRNPATGETIQIPAKTVIKMRLSKSCKDALA
ncbi:MAG: HU family DNA-binding protein [Myxococcota bacterium]|nr:HU family DNA-binding protein [Myxococcota bacterium]